MGLAERWLWIFDYLIWVTFPKVSPSFERGWGFGEEGDKRWKESKLSKEGMGPGSGRGV